MNEKELTPDKIACEEENLILYFGNVRIQLGSGNFADKLSQVPPSPCKITGAVCRSAGSASSGELYVVGCFGAVRTRQCGAAVGDGKWGSRRTSRRTPGQQNRQRCLRKPGGVEQTIPTEVSGT